MFLLDVICELVVGYFFECVVDWYVYVVFVVMLEVWVVLLVVEFDFVVE